MQSCFKPPSNHPPTEAQVIPGYLAGSNPEQKTWLLGCLALGACSSTQALQTPLRKPCLQVSTPTLTEWRCNTRLIAKLSLAPVIQFHRCNTTAHANGVQEGEEPRSKPCSTPSSLLLAWFAVINTLKTSKKPECYWNTDFHVYYFDFKTHFFQ